MGDGQDLAEQPVLLVGIRYVRQFIIQRELLLDRFAQFLLEAPSCIRAIRHVVVSLDVNGVIREKVGPYPSQRSWSAGGQHRPQLRP